MKQIQRKTIIRTKQFLIVMSVAYDEQILFSHKKKKKKL